MTTGVREVGPTVNSSVHENYETNKHVDVEAFLVEGLPTEFAKAILRRHRELKKKDLGCACTAYRTYLRATTSRDGRSGH